MMETLLRHAKGWVTITEQIMGKLPLQIYKLLLGPYEISVPSLLPLSQQRNIKPALQMGSLEHQSQMPFPRSHSEGVERVRNQRRDPLIQWK